MEAGDVSGPGLRVIVYLGVGSNLDEPVEQVRSALRELDQVPGTRCLRASSLYLSPPLGPVEQPDFINAVAVVETGLPVETLLDRLQAIEDAHGRRRNGTRWGPRPLDLDILMYGDWCMDTERLVLPHPGLHKRSFVLYPLLEVATPDLRIPGRGSLRELVKGCREDNIRRL
jgi:2-amino-4-hydroxy-6-hydroxymethyldihydropteridine diphosphokinase